jgi:serine protease AprX
MRVERDWLRNLIFDGEETRRFTQDSAILPDVWLAGGMFYCRDPKARVDLLLNPYKGYSSSQLAAALRHRLEQFSDAAEPAQRLRDIHGVRRSRTWTVDSSTQRRVLLRPTWSIAVNQTNVAVALTLEELIAAVLPLSAWWTRNFATRDQEARIANAQAAWLQKVVGVMLMCSQEPSDPEEADLSRRREAGAWMSIDEVRRLRRASRADAEKFDHIVQDERTRNTQFDRLLDAAIRTARQVTAERTKEPPLPLLWSVGLNRASFTSVQRSVHTTKGDAARRLFDIKCDKLCWAIVDSGIDARHPAFLNGEAVPISRVERAYDFTNLRSLVSLDSNLNTGPGVAHRRGNTEDADRRAKRLRESLRSGRFLDFGALLPLITIPLDDNFSPPANDHGTHVAGILAARATPDEPERIGMCPDIRLCDLRVLDAKGRGDEFSVIAALQFIRYLNANSDRQIIHGVNLSLSLVHDVENYACGRTPICEECERLVASGVVVVVAAGNRGYETVLTSAGELEGYRDISITDPGNAADVITVGSTHRFEPHTYGVSYFSSRGPTGDGRIKPDVLAPGEKIESTVLANSYAPKDGTSMAAPHVSGVAALLMARNTEFQGDPARIKQIICRSATDLGREKYFQGAGVVDALRALQSV